MTLLYKSFTKHNLYSQFKDYTESF